MISPINSRFNLIEFWGGDNPLSMNEGEIEINYAEVEGEEFKYEVTKDQYKITQLTGDEAGKVRTMRFDRETMTWMYTDGTQIESPLMGYYNDKEGNPMVRIHTENGYADFFANEEYDSFAILDKLKEAEGEAWASK